eukprot:3617099-Prymnesium_polylepis.1
MVGTGTGVPRSEKRLGGTGYFSAELSVGLETLIFLARKRLESPVRHWLPLGRAAAGCVCVLTGYEDAAHEHGT